MSSRSPHTISLDSESLAAATNALSKVSQDCALSLRERITYRVLTASVDVVIVTYLVLLCISALLVWGDRYFGIQLGTNRFLAMLGFGSIVITLASIVGIVFLLLNIPLIRRTFQERKRLRELGVNLLSKYLWKASRRHHWLRRLRSGMLIVLGVLFAVYPLVFVFIVKPEVWAFKHFLIIVLYLLIALLFIGVRQLRNLREQMELATNAEELEKALETLQQQAGKAKQVSVPIDLVERAAKIESMQINKARMQAILNSVDTRRSGYAVAFDKEAAAQRAALSANDRLELEELLAQLSAGEVEGQVVEGTGLQGAELAKRVSSQAGKIGLEYVTDLDFRKIRVRQVRPMGQVASSPQPGGEHE